MRRSPRRGWSSSGAALRWRTSPEAAKLLDTDTIRRADANPSGGQALREAYIGRLSGFDIYESTTVSADDTHQKAAYAFFTARQCRWSCAPRLAVSIRPRSRSRGCAIRATRGYSMDKKIDIASWDTLFGMQLLDHRATDAQAAVRLGLRIGADGA